MKFTKIRSLQRHILIQDRNWDQSKNLTWTFYGKPFLSIICSHPDRKYHRCALFLRMFWYILYDDQRHTLLAHIGVSIEISVDSGFLLMWGPESRMRQQIKIPSPSDFYLVFKGFCHQLLRYDIQNCEI